MLTADHLQRHRMMLLTNNYREFFAKLDEDPDLNINGRDEEVG